MYTFCVFHQHSYISYYIYNRYKILLVNFFPLSLSLIIFVKLHSIVNYFFFFNNCDNFPGHLILFLHSPFGYEVFNYDRQHLFNRIFKTCMYLPRSRTTWLEGMKVFRKSFLYIEVCENFFKALLWLISVLKISNGEREIFDQLEGVIWLLFTEYFFFLSNHFPCFMLLLIWKHFIY